MRDGPTSVPCSFLFLAGRNSCISGSENTGPSRGDNPAKKENINPAYLVRLESNLKLKAQEARGALTFGNIDRGDERFYTIVHNLSASVEPQSAPSASKRFGAIPPGHFLQMRFRRNVWSMEAHRCAPLKLCIVYF